MMAASTFPREFPVGEPVPCPNCQALLRLPVGATTVRCPSCKAVLELDPGDEPAAPPPPARAAAVPLPFGRPAKPAAAPAPPTVRGKPVKARVVREESPSAAAPTAGLTAAELDEDERERDIRRQLRDLDAEARKKEARFFVASDECESARQGLLLLAIGALCSVASSVLAIFFPLGGLFGTPIVSVAGLGGVLLTGHWGFTVAGLGFCLAGPREIRGTALLGIALTLGHLMFNALATFVCVAPSVGLDMFQDSNHSDSYVYASLIVGNCVCNLTVTSNLPYYALHPQSVRYSAVVMLLVAAAFEFAKLSVIALLANQSATLAKDPDLAHAGMRFIYRIFALMLLGPAVNLAVALMFAADVVYIPLIMASVAYYLWWSFAWVAQYRVLLDIREILTPVRLLDRRDRVDTY